MQHHNYSLSDLENMIPWEREIYIDMLVQHIKDENERTLLSWRDDQFTGSGWHVPGGIVRFKETMEARLGKVAETEIGTLFYTSKAIHEEKRII